MTAAAVIVPSPPVGRTLRDRRLRANLVGWAFILPALIGFTVFYLLPIFRAVEISFTDWNLLRPGKWVGFSNYAKVWNDKNFWHAMKITVLYVLYNIPLQTALALAIAVLADRLSQSVLLRAVIVAPYLISNVVAAMVWLLMLDPLLGMTNAFIKFIGGSQVPFLTSPDYALMSVAGISIWRHVGFTALLFYTGLKSIPQNLYEAARIEGASEWKQFRYITLPLLRPVMAFIMVTSVIGSFQVFDVIAVTTTGGPANSTRVILYYIYENAFRFNKMGYASALSVVLFALLIGITLMQMRVMRGGDSDLA
ncbi:MAG: sugar ABC transporter permease [Rhizobiaceae bacterium]